MILIIKYHGVCVLNIIVVSPPSTWDAAGASRVLQGTQQMYRQYNRFSKDCSKPSELLSQPPSSSFSSSSQRSSSMDDHGSSSSSSSGSSFGATSALLESNMEDLEEEAAEEQSNLGLTSGQTQSTMAAAAVKGSFDQRWQQQAKKAGLIGALVAMAYPDRIAQRKVGGFRLKGFDG